MSKTTSSKMPRLRSTRIVASSVLALAALTACGSTVQLNGLASQPAASSDGLGVTDLSTTPDSSGTTAGATDAPTGSAGSPDVLPTDGASTGTTPDTSATTPGSTPTTSTVVRETKPISIGILAAKSVGPALAAIGGGNGPDVDGGDAIKYLVNTLNSQGGLNGRRIDPVYSVIDPMSGDYETQAQGACANFTQDHKVAAVLSFVANYYSPTYAPCIEKAGIPNMTTAIGGVDEQELSKFKTLFSVLAPTINRRFTALINGLTADGFLTKKNKIGVIVEDCPQNNRAYAATVAPKLNATGIPYVKRVINCANGFADAAAIIGAFGNSVLPFKAAGVDRVMFVSGFEQLGAGTFEKQAKSQSYSPSYALTSTSSVGVNDMNMPAGSLPRVEAVGWSSIRDVNTLQNDSSAQQRCRTLWKGYPKANERVNRKDVEMICEGFFSLEAGLKKSNGVSVASTLLAAFGSLGTSYVSPTLLQGKTLVSSSHRDYVTLFAITKYNTGCACFKYATKPSALA